MMGLGPMELVIALALGLGGGGLSAVDIDDSAEQISQPPAELG